MFVGFAENSFQPFERLQMFVFADYLGFIGGIMGLIAGLSVLSLVESVYHFVDIIQTKVRAKLRSRRVIAVQSSSTEVIQGGPKRTNVRQKHALYQFTKYFAQFMATSDAHGFRYIRDKDQHVCGRLFWLVAVAASIAACVVLTSSAFDNAELKPFVIRLDDDFLDAEDVSRN
jgi:Amiloride-sensitive sodium channel